MKTWTKLAPPAESDFERLLLDSASDDAAPAEGLARVAASLSLKIDGLDVGSRTEEPAPANALAPAAGVRAHIPGKSLNGLLKYTLIGITAGMVVSSAGSDAARETTPLTLDTRVSERVEPLAENISLGSISSAAPAPARAPTGVPKDAEPERTAMREATRAVPRAAVVPARRLRVEAERDAKASDPSAAELLAEVRRLDRVRSALEGAPRQAALRELDAYDARFPRGALGVEARVLRVRALQRAGQYAAAARLARRVLAQPGSERYRSELGRLVAAE